MVPHFMTGLHRLSRHFISRFCDFVALMPVNLWQVYFRPNWPKTAYPLGSTDPYRGLHSQSTLISQWVDSTVDFGLANTLLLLLLKITLATTDTNVGPNGVRYNRVNCNKEAQKRIFSLFYRSVAKVTLRDITKSSSMKASELQSVKCWKEHRDVLQFSSELDLLLIPTD